MKKNIKTTSGKKKVEIQEISIKKSKKVAKIHTNGFSIDELIEELVKEKEKIEKNKDKIIYQEPIKSVREEDKKIIFDLEKGSFYLNLIDSKYYHQNNKVINSKDFDYLFHNILFYIWNDAKIVAKEPWIIVFLYLLFCGNPQDKKKILFAEKIAKQNWSHKSINDEEYRDILIYLTDKYTDVEVFLKDHFWFLSNFDHIKNMIRSGSNNLLDLYEVRNNKETFEIFKIAVENEHLLYQDDINDIAKIMKFNLGYNLEKLINYIFVSMPNQGLLQDFNSGGCDLLIEDEDWSYFFDYVKMNKDMNNHDFEKYPRYLKTYHDITSVNHQKHHDKTLQDKLSKVVPKHKIYEYKNKEYSVIHPKSYDDLVNEGKKLYHCVASYGDRLAEGETIIMFLRNNESLNIPFVTLEIRGTKGKLSIYQAKGKNNATPDSNVLNFLEEYKKFLNQKTIKVNV